MRGVVVEFLWGTQLGYVAHCPGVPSYSEPLRVKLSH